MKLNPGTACGCCDAECFVTVCVKVCFDNPVAGVTVTIKNGATVIDSGVTDATGCVVLDSATAGTYTIQVTAPARYAAYSATHTLVCGATVTVNLVAATGYMCVACFAAPIPEALVATCDGVVVAITYNAGLASWRWCATKSVANFITRPRTSVCNTTANNCTGPATGDAGASFILDLLGNCDLLQRSAKSSDCESSGLTDPLHPINNWISTCPDDTVWNNTFCIDHAVGGLSKGNATRQIDETITFGAPETPLPVPVNLSLTFIDSLFTAVDITE